MTRSRGRRRVTIGEARSSSTRKAAYIGRFPLSPDTGPDWSEFRRWWMRVARPPIANCVDAASFRPEKSRLRKKTHTNSEDNRKALRYVPPRRGVRFDHGPRCWLLCCQGGHGKGKRVLSNGGTHPNGFSLCPGPGIGPGGGLVQFGSRC